MKNIKMHIAGKLFQLKLRLVIRLVFLMQSPMSLWGCAGQTLQNTLDVSLELKRGHSSAYAASLKEWPYLNFAKQMELCWGHSALTVNYMQLSQYVVNSFNRFASVI